MSAVLRRDLSALAPLVSMTALLLLVTLMAGRMLAADPLWYDEWWSVYASGGAHYGTIPVSAIIERIAMSDWSPPGYYLVLNGWGALFGWTPFAGRLLSLMCGLLATAVIYRLGCDMRSRRTGLSAAVMFGCSAFVVHYLHELRFYAPVALLGALAMWFAWRIIERQAGTGAYAGLLLSTALLAYTHYFGLLWAFAIGVCALLMARKDRRWLALLITLAAAAALFLPWLSALLAAADSASTDPRQADALTAWQVLQRLLFMFANGGVAFALVLLSFALLNVRQRSVQMLVITLAIFLGLVLAINALLGVLTEMRYVIAAWISLALLAAIGLDHLSARGLPAWGVLVAWAVGGVWAMLGLGPLMISFNGPETELYNRSYALAFQPMPWDELRGVLRARERPEDVVMLDRPDAVWATQGVFDYYTHGLAARRVILETLPGGDTGDEFERSVDRFIDAAPRAWLAIDTSLPANFRLAQTQSVLAQRGFLFCEHALSDPNMTLDLYARSADPEWQIAGVTGAALLDSTLTDDGLLHVVLNWQTAPGLLVEPFSYALHLARAGDVIPMVQTDRPLPAQPASCTSDHLATDGLTDGAYDVRLMIYNWQTGERLPFASGGDAVVISTLHAGDG